MPKILGKKNSAEKNFWQEIIRGRLPWCKLWELALLLSKNKWFNIKYIYKVIYISNRFKMPKPPWGCIQCTGNSGKMILSVKRRSARWRKKEIHDQRWISLRAVIHSDKLYEYQWTQLYTVIKYLKIFECY